MSLKDKTWQEASLHAIVLAWLRAEVGSRYPVDRAEVGAELENPDLLDPGQNWLRLRTLYKLRNLFWVELPPDIKWYEVSNLTDADLDELYVVNYSEWNDPEGKSDNRLRNAAARRRDLRLKTPPQSWEPPILLGHSKTGPFTIIEGNNRLTAYARTPDGTLNTPVFIGLSYMNCLWNSLDVPCPLMQDLLPQPPHP